VARPAQPEDPDGQLPVYRWGQAPAELLTRAQLADQGLRPGTPTPRGLLVWGRRWRPRTAALFALAEAQPKRQATPAQLGALARAQTARRTCPACRRDAGHVLVRPAVCGACVTAAYQARVDRAREWAVRTARAWLDAEDLVVLDTETTDLYGFVVELAVIDRDGRVLLDTLLDPQAPVHPDAAALHGLTAEHLAGQPTFGELVDDLADVLHGKRIVAYNAPFDRAILAGELDRLHQARQPRTPVPWTGHLLTSAWLAKTRWTCAMRLYAAWMGEWSDYWSDWKWFPLPGGGHRARPDCAATLQVVHDLAADAVAASAASSQGSLRAPT
jgi:Exonuclease